MRYTALILHKQLIISFLRFCEIILFGFLLKKHNFESSGNVIIPSLVRELISCYYYSASSLEGEYVTKPQNLQVKLL